MKDKGKKLIYVSYPALSLNGQIGSYEIISKTSSSRKDIQSLLDDAKRILNEVPKSQNKVEKDLMVNKARTLFQLAKDADKCVSQLEYALSVEARLRTAERPHYTSGQRIEFFPSRQDASSYIRGAFNEVEQKNYKVISLKEGEFHVVRKLGEVEKQNLINKAADELNNLKTTAIGKVNERREDPEASFSISKAIDNLIAKIFRIEGFRFFSKPTSETAVEEHVGSLERDIRRK